MDAIHERGIVAHVRGQGAQEVTDPLLMLDLDVEVAHHHDAALGPNALLAARELPGFHVALEDVHPVLLVEGDTRDLVEAHHVVLADEPSLPRGVVDEHLRHPLPCRRR